MKFFLLLSKRNLIIITALTVIIMFIWGAVCSASSARIDGSTNAKRMAFIAELGYSADDSAATVKEITIPSDFGEVYREYNKLQKKAGYDLSHYKGKKAQVYTYPILYENGKELHLIVVDGAIIGGDVAEIKLGGKMLGLGKKMYE